MKRKRKTHCEEMLEYYKKVMKRGYVETTQGKKELTQSDVEYYTRRITECSENISKGIEECY
jgi:hypothetical protein